MDHENYIGTSANAIRLLLDLARQYNGRNNGDLSATFSVMRKRGWTSKGTIERMIKELLDRGWICVTRPGGKHRPTLYAVTWLPIDDCDGKLDVAETRIPSNEWKKAYPAGGAIQ